MKKLSSARSSKDKESINMKLSQNKCSQDQKNDTALSKYEYDELQTKIVLTITFILKQKNKK